MKILIVILANMGTLKILTLQDGIICAENGIAIYVKATMVIVMTMRKVHRQRVKTLCNIKESNEE